MANADSDRSGAALRNPLALGLARLLPLLAPRCVLCDLDDGDPLSPGCTRDCFAGNAPRCAACALRASPAGRARRAARRQLPALAARL